MVGRSSNVEHTNMLVIWLSPGVSLQRIPPGDPPYTRNVESSRFELVRPITFIPKKGFWTKLKTAKSLRLIFSGLEDDLLVGFLELKGLPPEPPGNCTPHQAPN